MESQVDHGDHRDLLFAGGLLVLDRVRGNELEFHKWLQTEVSAYGIFVSCAILLFLCRRKIPALPAPVYPLLLLAGIALHWWSVPMPAANHARRRPCSPWR
jgi:hypothetical protein